MRWRKIGFIGCVALVLGVGGCSLFWIGALVGEGGAYRRHCDEQRQAIRAILGANPAFADVTVSSDCDGGWVILNGHVSTKADWLLLRREVARAIGEQRAEYAVSYVEVR